MKSRLTTCLATSNVIDCHAILHVIWSLIKTMRWLTSHIILLTLNIVQKSLEDKPPKHTGIKLKILYKIRCAVGKQEHRTCILRCTCIWDAPIIFRQTPKRASGRMSSLVCWCRAQISNPGFERARQVGEYYARRGLTHLPYTPGRCCCSERCWESGLG